MNDARTLPARLRRLARRRFTVRDVLVGLAVVAGVLVPSAVIGVATASAEANLGPHRALYEITMDQRVTADLGPLGRLVLDSPLPVLGARVTVGEIPREITDLSAATTLEALTGDLDRYIQLFSAPQATLDVVVRALIVDAIRGTVIAAVTLTLLLVAVRWLLGPRRRAELAGSLPPRRSRVAVGAGLVVLLVGSMTASAELRSRSQPGPSSPVFAGTPLDGAVVTGRLAGILDTFGGQVVDAYRDNEEFYAAAEANLREAWAERDRAHERVLAVRESSGLQPARPEDAPDLVRLLVVSDLHCNVGMAPVIRAALEESGADVLLDGGDTTMNGTSVERYCITAFDQAAGDVPVVVATGNHDSSDTVAQQRAHGWTVLTGDVVEVAGVRILGDQDPRSTQVGVGTVLEGEDTLADRAQGLRDVACGDERGVDLLLTHDQQMGRQAVEDGCVPAQVSGHYHRRIGPVRSGSGIQYVSSSTAGALLGMPTIGPLNGVAEMTVLTFDPLSRQIIEYQLVQVHPDTSVRISHPLAWPRISAGPLAPPPRPGEPR